MKILVVFTGGTIGSTVKNGIADVSGEASKILLDICSDYDNAEFEYLSPFNILSENANCGTLTAICNFMLDIDYEKYDGVIITHGSDTLAYTSAMLGLVLSWVKIPVVITAADYVLTLPQSNGTENFKASIDFISDFVNGIHNNTGVFTVWKNKGESIKVYISTRLNEADGYLDSFTSWGGEEFGIIENNHFKRTSADINPECTMPCEKTAFLRKGKVCFRNDVLLLHSYVGMDFNAVDISGKSAVLLKLYHSATFCNDGTFTSFSKFAERCFENGVDVFVYSVKSTEYKYKSVEGMENSRIIPLYNINTPSAYCKVMLAYAVDVKLKDNIIENNLFYEQTTSAGNT